MRRVLIKLFASWQQPVTAAMLGLLFAASIVFISPIYYHSNLDTLVQADGGLFFACLKTLFFALCFFVFILIMLVYGGSFFRWLKRFNPLKILKLSWSGRSILIVTAIILVCWLPWIIIYYPGTTPYDPVAQIYQIN